MAWVTDSRRSPIELPSSVSLGFGNLSVLHGNQLAYAHGNKIHIVDIDSPADAHKINAQDQGYVFNATWVQTGGETYFVITASAGLLVYNEAGTDLLYSFPLVEHVDPVEGILPRLRGVTALMNESRFCVGTFEGDIYVFDTDGTSVSKGEDAERVHNNEIITLASNPTHMASGDAVGTIVVWHDLAMVAQHTNEHHVSCTNIAVSDEHVIATYATGHIRLFGIASAAISCEIAAHSRCINGLALAPNGTMFATVAEDCKLLVWSTPDDNGRLELLFQHKLNNALLTGVQFLARNGIAVVAYDSEKATIFERD